jgi:hypothetical protein
MVELEEIKIGKRYGLLTAIKPIGEGRWGMRWLFACDCGREVELYAHHVLQAGFDRCGDDCEEWRTQQRKAGVKGVPRNTRKAPESANRAVKVKGRRKERAVVKPTSREKKLAGWARAERKYARKFGEKANQEPTGELKGRDYDLLYVRHMDSFGKGTALRYLCLCSCGNYGSFSAAELIGGRRGDCGHRAKERKRLRSLRKKRRIAAMGRKRAPWARFFGLKR